MALACVVVLDGSGHAGPQDPGELVTGTAGEGLALERLEPQTAAAILGELPDSEGLRRELALQIRAHRPDVVLGHERLDRTPARRLDRIETATHALASDQLADSFSSSSRTTRSPRPQSSNCSGTS